MLAEFDNLLPDFSHLADAVAVLARLLGSSDALSEDEAPECVAALRPLLGGELNGPLADPSLLRSAWNRCRHSFIGPAAILSLEESVYKSWTSNRGHPLAGKTGFSCGDPAVHMVSILERFGLALDPHAALAPDHLASLLEFLGFLLEEGWTNEADAFCKDHLDWLELLKDEAHRRGLDEIGIQLIDAAQHLERLVTER